MHQLDLTRAYTDLWMEDMRRGFLTLRGDLNEPECAFLLRLLESWSVFGAPDNLLRVVVDCYSGASQIWGVARKLARFEPTTYARHAGSAGLIVYLAGAERICTPHSTFLFHGQQLRHDPMTDERRAAYMAERTGSDAGYWLSLCDTEEGYTFGADEAARLGVAHAVRDDLHAGKQVAP